MTSDLDLYAELIFNKDQSGRWTDDDEKELQSLKSNIESQLEAYPILIKKLSTESRENVIGDIKIEKLESQIKQLTEENKQLKEIVERLREEESKIKNWLKENNRIGEYQRHEKMEIRRMIQSILGEKE